MEQALKKHQLKIQIGTIVAVIIFVITGTWWAARSTSKIEAKLEEIQSQAIRNKARIILLEADGAELNMNMVEIKTKLSFIETTLLEIKEQLK